jgi:GT2 family glycosyltransferase
MSVSIIILQYGKPDYTKNCIISLLEKGLTSKVKNIYLIDNNSDDSNCIHAINNLKSLDNRIKVRINSKNLGFGLAHNEIIQDISDDYILLLNNDTLIIDNSINRFISICEKNKEKVATGVLLNKDLSLQPNTKGFFGFPAPIKKFFKKNAKNKRIVPYCNGALLWIDRRVFNEVGGFDPLLFMYNEDLDLMIKLNLKDYWVTQYLFCKIIHFGGTSAASLWNDGDKLKLQIRQGNKILRNYYSRKFIFIFNFLYSVSAIFKSFIYLIKLDMIAFKKTLCIYYWKFIL